MRLESLVNTPGARRDAMRVGRGKASGKGKTCGRGHKGQMARKGHKRKPGFEGGQMRLIRRIPKRGFKNPRAVSYAPVNVGDLARFDAGSEVTVKALKDGGLVTKAPQGVKILGSGALDRRLVVKAQAFSAAARLKIEAAGGVCEVTAD
ncbi:MAG: 50S ribosomal protein L15 [Lentisphaerae bacterium]|nr:50S ribosomal protein L15 [Lentisphaerota bacterium]